MVDPLSLSSLLSQGFDETDARRALRMHNNDTQAAMDWIVNGGKEGPTQTDVADGVRMPTTIRRIQKLRTKRKEERERLRAEKAAREAVEQQKMAPSSGSATAASRNSSSNGEQPKPPPAAPPPQPPVDLLSYTLILRKKCGEMSFCLSLPLYFLLIFQHG